MRKAFSTLLLPLPVDYRTIVYGGGAILVLKDGFPQTVVFIIVIHHCMCCTCAYSRFIFSWSLIDADCES